ncbi:MAG: hypothetical protein HC814_01965 [Rhodobacteraceae bacterium]|nr:hypothetical protein [Paracoccaceae bacterium]
MPTTRILGLPQPSQQTLGLQLRAKRRQQPAIFTQHRTQLVVGPLDAMFTKQQLPHLTLAVIDRPPRRPLSQHRCSARHDPQLHMQRMQTRFARLVVQIQKRPQRDGTKRRRDGCLGPLVDAVVVSSQ